MALTRLDNLISSKTGKYLYVSPDDFNATDELNNRGNSPIRPFKSIQRAFLEIARYSYLPGPDNDRFDQFSIMLMPGNHYIDNRPGLLDTNGISPFGFDQALNLWTDNSNLDIADPNNILYLFNNTEGGAILPRGSSLVGYDLRRTVIRPLYVPDPADKLEKRSAIFNVTGGCYFWQFTIKDGDLEPSSPLYDSNEGIGKVYYQKGDWTAKAVPNFSHHKLTVFEYADKDELGLYYQKVAKSFSLYQPTIDDPGEFTDRIQETRIVGPLSDLRSIESIKLTDSVPAGTITAEVTTKVNHGYFKNQFVAIENNGLDDQLNGAFAIDEIDLVDQRKFKYKISGTVAALGTTVSLVNGTTYTPQNGLSPNAIVKAEVDSVESASPYVFNCSIRSTWGICGIWANGLKATGFKSMVIAQYTGVSLQKDDRAFIRYDEYTNTWNQASLADAFATVPYHTKGDAYWKDDWRNFHVRASEDAFIQNVSIFAVGFADHFLMESGGDMSITNSNSNFGNTSLHAIGFKGFAFNQDKGGYITDIIPPQTVATTSGNIKRNSYYTLDIVATKNRNTNTNLTKIYLGDDEGYNPQSRPAASIDGYRIGARSDEKLYVKLIPRSAGSSNIFNATLTPNGFKKFTAAAEILNPSGVTINHKNLDAANRIEDNKEFIANEAYGYITNKYPYLLDRPGIDITKCKRDIGYLVDATIQDLRLGGNINTIQAAEAYYVGNNLSYINAELTESLEAYDYTRDLAVAAMRNFSYLRTSVETTGGSAIVDVGDTTGIVQGMTVADYDPSQFTDGKLNAGATRPQAPVIPDDTYVKRVVSATEIELGQKATYSTKKLVSDRFGDARDLILANKQFIAAEAVARMHLDFPGFSVPGGDQNCIDDVVDVLEAVAENTAYGGNEAVWDAAYLYATGSHIAGEEDESIRVFNYARDMSIQIMRNEDVFVFGSHGLTQVKDTSIIYEQPNLVNDRNGDARNLILANKNLIANESVARMLIAYPGFSIPNGNQNCIDDVVDILEAVSDNVAYGGNDKTWDAAYSYVTGAHVDGEELETLYVFEQAKRMAAQAMRNEEILIVGSHGLSQTFDLTIQYNEPDPVVDKSGDARDLIEANKNFIAEIALGRMLTNYPGFSVPNGNVNCLDDIKDMITVVAHNLAYGGNDRVWDAANLYASGAYVVGEEAQTNYAFNQARDMMIQAMRNESITVGGHTTLTQTFDNTITIDTVTPYCPSQASAITSLVQLLTNTVSTPSSLYGAARTPSVGSCEDVRTTINTLFKIIEDAVTVPSTLSTVPRTISIGSCQNVASAITTLFKLLTDTIQNPGYIDSVSRNPVPLGLEFGPSINANANSTNSYLYFVFSDGVYTDIVPTVDETIIQHTTYPECVDQATTIRQYFANISTIIQTGLGSVPRNEPTQLTTELASRATVWTLRDGVGANPHQLETGTPVRLVPRPRYDITTQQYVDVDKRVVRLPNGFETNEEYYVIAPGRTTKPEDYSSVGAFDGSDQTKIMLASSKENAAAGIYIHSSEVEDIDPDVEIDVYQFVLDDNYDLHEYSCVLDGQSNTNIRTDVPHIFDVPFPNVISHEVFFRLNEGGNLPLVGSAYSSDPTVSDANGRLLNNKYFYARYINEKLFTIHKTKPDAEAGVNAITFQPGIYDFSVFANKRESPMRFDPTYQNPGTTPPIFGKWYLQTENDSGSDQIIPRLREYADGNDKTNDSWFERVKDEREATDRIYRLRYVIPKYLQAVRDPINGFIIKTRTDETRKLVPQKIVLKPISGNVTKARFANPVQQNEYIGYTKQDFIQESLNDEVAYDPYKKDLISTTQYEKVIETQNYVSMTIQSGRYFLDDQDGNEYLELTVFNQGITNTALLNETFTTIKITPPQGGSFTASKTQSSDAVNRVEWFGNSSGYAYLHAITNVPGTSDWYMILKGVVGKLDYSTIENIRIAQGAAFADLLDDPDFGKSLYIKDLIRKGYPEYYYRQNGSAVYTITPGDIIEDDASIQYYVESVEDVGIIDDTFYIFDVEEIQRRIFGQQDGIYYLTAIRGNISPYPQGAGNLGNFRNYKFSQPVSKLYPLNYKNDPLWYKQLDATLVDPPATYSAADNYVHGLVRVNDFKGSMTKEAMIDLLDNTAFIENSYTQVSSEIDNRLRAKKGNAASGSEDRRIPIAGDSTVISDQRYYVELRRPSIARAGNHTFEYLGFGPGNYSTGLPARQEVVLTSTQDFYAQSKKQDGGIVFYTGLNSNGDLYIGNRKIDAITGEEEFLESAKLVDSADDTENIGNLVTTFDTPVTFNEYITVNGGEAQDRRSTFNSPVLINVLGTVRDYALTISSFVDPALDDGSLDRSSFLRNAETGGDIVLARNKISAAIFQFNSRRDGQPYKIQTHVVGSTPSNITPNQLGTFGSSQIVAYGNAGAPLSGDMLLKGNNVGKSGSLGWIYANFYTEISPLSVFSLAFNNTTIITINWAGSLTNTLLGITSGSQIRIKGFSDSSFDGTWQVISNGFNPSAGSCQFAIAAIKNSVDNDNPRLWADEYAANNDLTIEFSNSNWKEFGVIGSESIRTETDSIGDYKVGINTVARSERDSYQTNYVDTNTNPRANLDVVGTAFISGKKVTDYGTHAVFGQRTLQNRTDAFMVGGDAYNPNNAATFRISTANNGRVGINVSNAELDRALVVGGLSRFTDDARFQYDIEVHGGGGANIAEIRTNITTGTFNFLPDSTFVGNVNVAPYAGVLRFGDTSTGDQFVYVGNASLHSNIWIGNTPDGSTNISKVTIGGAYNNNESLSFVQVDTKAFKTSGDFQLGTRRGLFDTVKLSSTAGTVEFFSGNSATSKLDFATNASDITIGGQGGQTKIRNNLLVDSTARFNADITLCGGFASYSFTAFRAQIGSTRSAHNTGDLGNNIFNANVDIVQVLRVASNNVVYNEVDTAGTGTWGGSVFQNTVTAIGGTPSVEPQILPQLTGNQYYLPIKNRPYDAQGAQYFSENDILLIDTNDSDGVKHPEFVRIISLPRINIAPYYIVVERLPFGTFTSTRSDHPDTTSIYKCIVQFDATWTVVYVDAVGTEENIYLSQFGGTINQGDYIIIDREDSDNNGLDDTGEIFKVNTLLDLVPKRLMIKSGCDGPNETTVFSIDSTTGQLQSSGSAQINGSISLVGGCTTPFTNSPTNEKFSVANGLDVTTFEIDTCTGDTNIGNNHGTVFFLSQQFGTSPAAYQKDDDTVYVYRFNPQTELTTGPITTLSEAIVQATSNIKIQSNLSSFMKGDLCVMYVTGVSIEIIRITDDPYTDGNGALIIPTASNLEYPTGGRGQEGTTAKDFGTGVNFVKIDKYERTTTLLHDVPATTQARATALRARTPNNSDLRLELTLRDADLISPKLDYFTMIRIGTEFFVADSVDGSLDIFYAIKMPKQIRYPNTLNTIPVKLFGGGKTNIYDDLTVYSGAFRMYGSDGKTLVMSIANDDGHSGDGSIEDPLTATNGLTLKGSGTFYGDLKVYYDDCQMNGICSTETSFRVTNREGSVEMGQTFYQKGKVFSSELAAEVIFHIDNLGSAGNTDSGNKDFRIYQNNAIDSFGIEKYWTGNGGRRQTYVSFDPATGIGQQQDNPLQVNNNYLINVSSGSNMILYLPSNAQTGDMIRFIELSGNLTYNTSLILRALKINNVATAIQGDSIGTRVGAGAGQSLATTWDSGELIIQSRNASFGLVYAGIVDIEGSSNARTIPPALRGWWLMEL